ncbi:MAG: leukotoxin LktA family filamentous adhesin, partial [Pseudolabrys sp.]
MLAYNMAIWPVLAQQPNAIVTDGRTQTQLQTSGNVTNVTTSTISGVNGFNSFSQFGVGRGNTVNLQLPGGTQNLINIVRDAPAYVNGTLNSYKNGQIGGNVYFADPHGFVVGRSGVVNVGSLNVSTPTREFVDSMISPSGQINDAAVANLLAGTVPISPDGNIRIRGRVNAVDAVRLTGQNVFVGSRETANREQAVKFASTVNSRGLHSANGIVVRNGSIQIVAANDAKISGRMVAKRNAGAGGDIVVTAGNAIRIAPTAKLNAAGKTGDGGNILLRAGKNLALQSGASFNVSSATGNAGVVETSSFGTFDIASGLKINLSAPNGKAGTLLVDPTVTVIGDSTLDAGVTLSNTGVVNLINAVTDGTLLIQATGAGSSITLAEHALIDTRRLDVNGHSTGNAYNVTLESPSIEIKNGAQILTQTVNSGTSYTNGNVQLIASLSDSQLVGGASASAEITIAGTITAGAITATATATATASYSSSAQNMAQLAAGVVIGMISGIGGGYVKAESSAKVTVESTARLTASGAIILSSVGEQTASTPAIVVALAPAQSIVGAAVVVGILNADIATQVKSGARISSGNFSAIATNNATMDVVAQVVSTNTSVDGALAYTTGTVNTRATVDSGVIFDHVGNVLVGAQNNNSFSTAASSISAGTGNAAIAVAISDVSNNAVANLGASLPQTANAGSVVVYSGSVTEKNAVSASTTVGSNFLTSAFVSKLHGGSSVGDIFAENGAFQSSGAGQAATRNSTVTNARAGITLALNLASLSSTASITNLAPNANGDMVTSGTAPTIRANGGVSVISTLTDAGIRGSAASAINSPSDPTTTNTATGSAVSMAVNVTQITQKSTAYIGSGVSITAPRV